MDDFHRRAEAGSAKTEAAAGRAHKALTALAVVAAVVFTKSLTSSVQAAAQFEVALRNVATISDSVRDNFDKSGKAIFDLSTRLPQSAHVLAEGLYEIASSGFQGAEGMEVLDKSAKAASAGLTTTNNAAKGITAVLNAYGKSAFEAGDVSDVLFQTVNLGVVSFEELSSQLGDFVGTAAQLGVPIDDASAAFAAMTLSGISAAESATAVKRVMLSFVKPSEAMTATLKANGHESGVAAVQTLGLKGAMELLGQATGGSIEALGELFPEVRGLKGALASLAAEGENYNRTQAGIADATSRTGATQRALDEQMKSASAQWGIFKNQIDAGRIALATALLPVLVDVMHGIQGLAHDAMPGLTAAGAALVPFFETLGAVGSNLLEIIKNLAESVGPLAAALAAIVGAGVIATLTALAAVLQAATGFLADHHGAVTAVAVAYGALFAIAKASAALAALPLLFNAMSIGAAKAALAAGNLSASLLTLKGAAVGLGAVAGVLAFTAAIGGMQKARDSADALFATLTKPFDLSAYKGLTDALDEIGQKQADLEANTKTRGGLFNAFRGAVELISPMENSVQDAREALIKLNEEAEKLAQTRVNIFSNLNAVADATGKPRAEIEKLAKALGVDLTKGFADSEVERAKLTHHIKELETNAYGAGRGLASMAGQSVEAITAASEAVDRLAKKAGEAFAADFDVLSNFADATKDHAAALEEEASASEKAAAAQDRVSEAGERAAEAYGKIADAQERAVEAQGEVIEAQDRVVEAEKELAELRVDLAERAAEAQERYAERVAESNEAIARADADVLEARERVVEAEEKVAEMRADFAERAAEAQERYAEKVEDSNEDILRAEEDLAQKRIDLAEDVADAQRRLEDDRLEGQERIKAAEQRIRDVQKRSADEARERNQREQDRRRLDAAGSPEERRRIQDQIDARKAREDEDKARKQATADLKDAQDDLAKARKDAAETEEKNRIALAKAQENQAKGILEAEEKVTEARERGIEIQREAVDLAKQQVQDEKAIAEAVEGIEDAREGVLEAEKGAADARKEALDVQKEGAELSRQQVDDEKAIADAIRSVGDARSGVLDAQKGVADAVADIARAEDDAARAGREVGKAQSEAASAYAELAAAQQRVADTSLEGFFQNQIAEAKKFAEGIKEAARQGLDPAFIAQLLQEGPEKAAPILDAIMNDQTGTLVRQMNSARDGLRSVQDQMVEAARVTQRAINATNTDMAADYGRAMDILAAKAALGGQATSDAIAEKLGIGVEEVKRIAKDYVIVLTDGINPLLRAIGAGEITSAGRGAGGGVPEGVYVGNMATGGTVPGQGDRDTVPAMLTPGEYVISKPAVQRIGVENLEAMHQQARRGYAQGGFVYPNDVPVPPGAMDDWGTALGYSGAMANQKAFYAVREFLAKNPPNPPSGGSGSNYGYQALIDFLNWKGVDHEVTSAVRDGAITSSGNRSLHADGLAADFVSSNMRQIFDTFKTITPSLAELFFDPAGHSVKNGSVVDWIAGGHDDHVHAGTFGGPGAGPGVPTGRGGDVDTSGDIRDWIDQAMRITGVGEDWREPLYRRAMFESGGRNIPQGIHDVNTDMGTPAYGPFQVIRPTFDAHKMDGYDDWHNPVHNAIAAIRYIQSRYGSIHEIDPPTQGYGKGGLVDILKNLPKFHAGGIVPGDQEVIARLEGGEGVLSRQTMAMSTSLPAHINTAVSTALSRHSGISGHGGANPLAGVLDYDRLGEVVADATVSALARADLKVEADRRQIGKLVAEEFKRMSKH